ncbi:MAG: M14 family metallopeptidase [Bacillota bacterium]|jgi:murein tripeptide amidase MpaA
MERVKFDRFHNYAEITALLQGWVAAFPQLATLTSAGTSPEGREQWVLELTNQATGPASEKPAYFICGNVHAGEVAGSAACLYTIQHLLFGYGQDELCTRVLDTRTVYVMPRVTMDGSEYYLTTPGSVRSAARRYPADRPLDGLIPEDVDGNGLILQMRVPDPHGDWKVSEKDPRLMVRRGPDDIGGEYYRVLPEGMIHNYDGVEIKLGGSPYGLDFNRNFAANWQPEHRQRGAGSYPFSEPETRAVADFLLAHKNIGGSMAYHTAVGVFLRPFEHLPDSKMPPADLALYKTLGRMGEEETGFPLWSIYHEMTDDLNRPTLGCFPDWAYAHLGMVGLEIELWDLPGQAGIPLKGMLARRQMTEQDFHEQQLKILEWNDRELGGAGFIDWYGFQHPQLGLVELGGWNSKYVRQNPPGHLLEKEIHGSAIYTVKHAAASPLLKIEDVKVEALGDGLHRIQLVVVNTGFLATNLTQMAIQINAAKPVEARLQPGEGVSLLGGKRKIELGHIPGFSKKKAEWVVQGRGQVELTVWSEKGGTVRQQLTLE